MWISILLLWISILVLYIQLRQLTKIVKNDLNNMTLVTKILASQYGHKDIDKIKI